MYYSFLLESPHTPYDADGQWSVLPGFVRWDVFTFPLYFQSSSLNGQRLAGISPQPPKVMPLGSGEHCVLVGIAFGKSAVSLLPFYFCMFSQFCILSKQLAFSEP